MHSAGKPSASLFEQVARRLDGLKEAALKLIEKANQEGGNEVRCKQNLCLNNLG